MSYENTKIREKYKHTRVMLHIKKMTQYDDKRVKGYEDILFGYKSQQLYSMYLATAKTSKSSSFNKSQLM